jgi:hypothetical protein
MNHSKRYLSFLLVLPLLTVVLLINASAQPEPAQLDPSYEISLYVVVGSNDSGARSDLPASMSAVAKQLKSNFSFTSYRVGNTFIGRVANSGNIEYKSVSNIVGQDLEQDSQTFLEWSLNNFRVLPNGFQARNFRFGARVPVRTGSTKDDAGKMLPIINYEAIGLNIGLLGLPANKPTLVGTIGMPKMAGTIFLVATIKTAEM